MAGKRLHTLLLALVMICCCATPLPAADSVPAAGGMTEAALFYIIGGLAVASAIGCVVSINVVRMAVWLFGALGAVAMMYFLLGATFLGAIQLIVYVGGILVVIVFGIMLTSPTYRMRFIARRSEVIGAGVVGAVLLIALVVSLVSGEWVEATGQPGRWTLAEIGDALLTTYLVPFEIVSVMLLAVMIGAAYLATRDRPQEGEE